MGANIKELFQQMVEMTDEEIAELHSQHNRESIRSLLPRLHYFQVSLFSVLFMSNNHNTLDDICIFLYFLLSAFISLFHSFLVGFLTLMYDL